MLPPDDPGNTPKYVAPGVFLPETSSLPPSIAGVETSVAGFVGVAAMGPASTAMGPFGSLTDFQAVFGSAASIAMPGNTTQPNYLFFAAKTFFENGGTRLYVSRVTSPDGQNSAMPTADDITRALDGLANMDEIAVVAAPGATASGPDGSVSVAPVHAALIAHASAVQAYRFAVLDPPQGASLDEVRQVRSGLDSPNAALYYPWVSSANASARAPLPPLRQSTINLPPSGFLCGIYARVDASRGVWKAPANEALTDATGFESVVTDADQEILNPLGINCLRSFPGRGNLVWGARTTSSDPNWMYVSVRRYLIYLEHSIDLGTDWAVFEPNSSATWNRLQGSIENFLTSEWRAGALQGSKPEQAFQVQCCLGQTMTQADIDNGVLIVLVAVAILQPAEFVFFRVTKKIA